MHSEVIKTEIHPNSNTENEEEEIAETVVEWSLQDSLGYEGVSMTTGVNVTGRIQRIYWRYTETTEQIFETSGYVYYLGYLCFTENIVYLCLAENINVPVFACLEKHFCQNKICFPNCRVGICRQ